MIVMSFGRFPVITLIAGGISQAGDYYIYRDGQGRTWLSNQDPHKQDDSTAYSGITLDNCWMVDNLKIIRNDSGGLYVAMPSKKKTERQLPGNRLSDYGRSATYD